MRACHVMGLCISWLTGMGSALAAATCQESEAASCGCGLQGLRLMNLRACLGGCKGVLVSAITCHWLRLRKGCKPLSPLGICFSLSLGLVGGRTQQG